MLIGIIIAVVIAIVAVAAFTKRKPSTPVKGGHGVEEEVKAPGKWDNLK